MWHRFSRSAHRRHGQQLFGILAAGLMVFVVLIGTTVPSTAAPPPSPTTERVSVDSSESQATGGQSAFAAVNADGRYVAFESYATDLVSPDTNGNADIFVRDRQLGTTERVSVDSGGGQADSGGSYDPAISADGRFVAFHSTALDLVNGDSNGYQDVFVHDRSTHATERVSVNSSGDQALNGNSYDVSISADGRYVAFTSGATNLIPSDWNGLEDVFVHDRLTGLTECVSVDSDGDLASDFRSYSPAISGNGRYVTFLSSSAQLVPGDTNAMTDTFVHDRYTGLTERVSVDSAGTQMTGGGCMDTSINYDGRYVAFHSAGTNLVSDDTNNYSDIFLHDRQTRITQRVSVDSSGNQATQGASYQPCISANGRYVAFHSFAKNLVAGDTNNDSDVFLRDRQTGTTERVNLTSTGTQTTTGNSWQPSVSADGRVVTFHSAASDLVTGDTNNEYDVFVRDEGGVGYNLNVLSDGVPGGNVPIASPTGCAGLTFYELKLREDMWVVLTAPGTVMSGPNGYRFVQWSLNGFAIANRTINFLLAGPTTAVAIYQPTSTHALHVMTYNFPGSTCLIESPTGHGQYVDYTMDLPYGTWVVLEAPHVLYDCDQYRFVRWWLNGYAVSNCMINFAIGGETWAVAEYEMTPEHTVHILSYNLPGDACPVTSTTGENGTTPYNYIVYEQKWVVLTAPPKLTVGPDDYVFVRWWFNGYPIENRTINFAVTGEVWAVVEYRLAQVYRLDVMTFQLPGDNCPIASTTGHSGVTNYSKSLDENEWVVLTAPDPEPNLGYRFVRWWFNGYAISNQTINFPMTSDVLVVAEYRPPPPKAPASKTAGTPNSRPVRPAPQGSPPDDGS